MENQTNYKEKLIEYIESGKQILTRDETEVFIPEEDEVFMQCWADIPERRELPKYWFETNKDNLISMYTGKPKWIRKDMRDSKRGKYVFTMEKDGKIVHKSIEAHNLMALVFGSDVYGSAKDLLQKEGVYSFGRAGENKNQGHHKDGDVTNNSPENIQIVPEAVHRLLHSMPSSENLNDPKLLEWDKNMMEVLKDEEPDKFTIIYGGETIVDGVWQRDSERSIHAVDRIKISPQALKQMQEIIQCIRLLEMAEFMENQNDNEDDNKKVG